MTRRLVESRQALPAILPLIPIVAPGGWLILTLKFRGLGRDRSHWLAKVPAMLGRECANTRLLWLYANTDTERTFATQLL